MWPLNENPSEKRRLKLLGIFEAWKGFASSVFFNEKTRKSRHWSSNNCFVRLSYFHIQANNRKIQMEKEKVYISSLHTQNTHDGWKFSFSKQTKMMENFPVEFESRTLEAKGKVLQFNFSVTFDA